MVSIDINKQFELSTPEFRDRNEESKINKNLKKKPETHLYNRFIHMMSESAIPQEPTREEEISYLNYLSDSFSSDPWFTIHPKIYQASPHRLWIKNMVEYRKEYRKTFFKNFILSGGITWPLIL